MKQRNPLSSATSSSASMPRRTGPVSSSATHRTTLKERVVGTANQRSSANQPTAAFPDTPSPPSIADGAAARSSRLASLRAQRDALRAQVSSQDSTLTALTAETAQLRSSSATESDHLQSLHHAQHIDETKRITLTSYHQHVDSTRKIWQEYEKRIRKESLIEHHDTAASSSTTSSSAAQFFTSDGSAEAGTKHTLRNALQFMTHAYEDTLAAIKQEHADQQYQQQNDFNSPPPPQPLSADEFDARYMKLTVDVIQQQKDVRELYRYPSSATATSSASSYHPSTLLTDLNAEITESIGGIEKRIEDLNNKEKEKEKKEKSTGVNGVTAATSPAASSTSSSSTSIIQTFTSLITTLQDESTSRFMSAQKLANESEIFEVMLEELLKKQTLGDREIMNPTTTATTTTGPPTFSSSLATPSSTTTTTSSFHSHSSQFTSRQLLLSIRKLQHLERLHSALKAQLAFLAKTRSTFNTIREKRQRAMNDFLRQRDEITSFHDVRKRNESYLIALVRSNMQQRGKIEGYRKRCEAVVNGSNDSANSNEASGGIVKRCRDIIQTYPSLFRDSVQNEASLGLSCIVAPLVQMKLGDDSQHNVNVPTNRLAINEVQCATKQAIQLHSLLNDPFDTNSSTTVTVATGNKSNHHHYHSKNSSLTTTSNWRGLSGIKFYSNPTQIILEMEQMLHKALFFSLLHRTGSIAHAALLHSAAVSSSSSSLDVTSPSSWSRMHQRLTTYRSLCTNDWSAQLHDILTRANETQDVTIKRVTSTLRDFWSQPAQSTIPHLRNRLGYNIEDYVEEVRSLVTQIEQQEQRYYMALKRRSAAAAAQQI